MSDVISRAEIENRNRRRLPERLRDAARGIEEGNLADPHGHRVGMLRAAAEEIEHLRATLRFYAVTMDDDGRRARDALGMKDGGDE
jgi:hypothetical protein